LIEIKLTEKEADKLERTLKWVTRACNMSNDEEQELLDIISKIIRAQIIGPKESTNANK